MTPMTRQRGAGQGSVRPEQAEGMGGGRSGVGTLGDGVPWAGERVGVPRLPPTHLDRVQ